MTLRIGDWPSPNQDERTVGTPTDTLILRYTGMRGAQAAIDRPRDPVARVSAHYVVDEDGSVVPLDPEEHHARHAGVSYRRGQSELNARFGVDIVNPGHEWGYYDFPALQMAVVCDISPAIPVPPSDPVRSVIALSDVAPGSRQAPGERFDWKGLVQKMVSGGGLMGCRTAVSPVRRGMRQIRGTRQHRLRCGAERRCDPELGMALRAVQQHWRQEAITGEVDAETGDCLQCDGLW